MSLRSGLEKAGLAVVAAAVGIVAAEGIARHMEPLPVLTGVKEESGGRGVYGVYEPAPSPMYYVLAPGSTLGDVHVNSMGLRDKDYTREKPPGVFRIVMLGDSVAFGAGVPQERDFESLLEHDLNRSGLKVEIINLGVPGYNVVMEQAYLEYKGMDLSPDLILVVVGPNDLTETPTVLFEKSRMRLLFRIDSARDDVPWSVHLPWGTDVWLMKNSALARMVFRALAAPDTKTFKRLQQENFAAMLGIAGDAGRAGAGLVFVLLPEMRDLSAYALQDVHDSIKRFLKEHGIEVIDLLPPLKDMAGDRWKSLRLSPSDTIHPNAEGHAIIAGALFEPVAEAIEKSSGNDL